MATPRPSYIDFGKRVILAGGFANDTYKFNAVKVYNESGSSIAADKLVAIGVTYDVTKGLPNVVLADANTSTHKDVYVTLGAIANNAKGYVFKGGKSASNLDTSGATTVGDPLYLSETAGAFTSTAPTTPNSMVLPVGWSTVKSSTVGAIHWHIGEIERVAASDAQTGLVAAGGTLTLTAAVHNGALIALDTAAGSVVTLPTSTGGGARYRFLVTVTATSNSHVIKVGNATDEMRGYVIQDASEATAPNTWWAADNDDTITLNRTTTGLAAQGEYFDIVDAVSGHFYVQGYSQANGIEATPFSATV